MSIRSKSVLQPSVYNLSDYQTEQISCKVVKTEARVQRKLVKEAKHKYQSFRLGVSEIRDINFKKIKNKLTDNKLAPVDINNNKLFADSKEPQISHGFEIMVTVDNLAEPDSSEASRQGTPNPWDLYKKQQELKKLANDMPYIQMHNEALKQALQFSNFDI